MGTEIYLDFLLYFPSPFVVYTVLMEPTLWNKDDPFPFVHVFFFGLGLLSSNYVMYVRCMYLWLDYLPVKTMDLSSVYLRLDYLHVKTMDYLHVKTMDLSSLCIFGLIIFM